MRSSREVYLDILRVGLLSIRGAAHDGNSEQCHAEADHLHNLPELLANLGHQGLHNYYWTVTRQSYLSVSKPEFACRYEVLWRELEEIRRRETS